jgi:Flp pilus assembly protein CpaB
MTYLEFTTGRTYDAQQVLQITVEEQGTDEWGIGEVTATFYDASRRVSGRVIKTPVFAGESIGQAILSAYDHGNYQTI